MSTSKPQTFVPQETSLEFLTALELEVFSTAIANYKTHGEFLRDDAIALHWIFGPMIYQVLELVDDDYATVMKSSTSGRVLVQVYGKSGGGEVYWIPPSKSMCQCIAFRRGKKNYCKHVLAAHIVLALHEPGEHEEIAESEILGIFRDVVNKK